MNPKVLILSDLYDFAADLVVLRLRQLGVPFLRLNREQLSTFSLTLDPLEPALQVRFGDKTWYVGPELRSVWYRQAVYLRNTPAQPLDRAAQLERSQWMAFLRALTVFESTAWMNHPRETYQAEIKPFQLAIAQRVGFAVPATLVCNDVQAIQAKLPPNLIIKPLDTVLIREGEQDIFAYSNPMQAEALAQSTTYQAPLIAQELKTNKVDWRVTIVGRKVYPVRVLARGRGIEGDWRRTPKAELCYEDGELPTGIITACLELLARLGLSFGGIDLIESSDGFSFVEVNPTGEFGWLVVPHRPLDEIIAQWLASGGSNE
jgi:glutathione synthase/RimK-type ligase-like ATP-grasp enzyme